MSNPFFSTEPLLPPPPTSPILGTPVVLTTYEGLIRQSQVLARKPGVVAIDFANTHVLAMRRHERWYREITDVMDAFIPDGMPLIWCLNRRGAGLPDRVYGPTFMRRCITESPAEFTHYLMGGTEECGRRLREVMAAWNPAARIVGEYHGSCSAEGRLEDESAIEALNRASPDFIWISFGAPKQNAFVHRYKARVRRGLMFTVGFAFDANAGLKRDAPEWMQRRGLTWLFRMMTEPRRLMPRYLRYNSLFLAYLAWDAMHGRALRVLPRTGTLAA